MNAKESSISCWTISVIAVLLWGIMLGPVMATHEVHHRFIITGYVRDENGRPISGERVIIVDTRRDIGTTTFTDGDGYYESLLHLHNDDQGDEITIMVGDQKKEIRAEFDPEDQKTERKVRVDFGAPAAPGSEAGLGTKVVPIALIVLAVVVVVWTLGRRKRSRKSMKKGSKDRR